MLLKAVVPTIIELAKITTLELSGIQDNTSIAKTS